MQGSVLNNLNLLHTNAGVVDETKGLLRSAQSDQAPDIADVN